MFRLRPFLLSSPAVAAFSPADMAVLDAWYAAGDWDVAYGPIGQWNDSSGNGNHLTQATGANQPFGLPYSAAEGAYLWLPGVNQNWAKASDSSIAGAFDDVVQIYIVDVAADDWDGAGTDQTLYAKWQAGQLSFRFRLNGNGGLSMDFSSDGTATATATASATDGGAALGHGFTDEDKHAVMCFSSWTLGRVSFFTGTRETTLGSELLTNNQANCDSNWGSTEPATVSTDGELVFNGTSSGQNAYPDTNQLTVGKIYWLSFDVTERTAGGIFVHTYGHRHSYIDSVGSYAGPVVASAAGFVLNTFGTTTMKLDNFSIKEMTNWTPLGVEQTGISGNSSYDSTCDFEIGADGNGVSNKFAGRIFGVDHYKRAIDYNTTPVKEFSPAASNDLASSVGDWTISNATAATPACVVGKAHVMFDGTNDDLASGSFDRTEPTTGYIKVRTITYSNSEFFMSSLVTAPAVTWMGARWLSGALWNGYGASSSTTTPIAFTPGGDENLCVSWTGDSSSLIQDGSAGSPSTGTLTGSAGANNPTGFRLGSLNGSGDYSNVFIDEAFFSGEADNAATIKGALEYLEAL